MTNSCRRQAAEAAFGHMQHAAREVIAAAHDTLDVLDDVVSKTDVSQIFDTVNHLSQLVRTKAGPPPQPTGSSREERRAASPVQRISVR